MSSNALMCLRISSVMARRLSILRSKSVRVQRSTSNSAHGSVFCGIRSSRKRMARIRRAVCSSFTEITPDCETVAFTFSSLSLRIMRSLTVASVTGVSMSGTSDGLADHEVSKTIMTIAATTTAANIPFWIGVHLLHSVLICVTVFLNHSFMCPPPYWTNLLQ